MATVLHVLTYGYTDNPKQLPADWPAIVHNVPDDTPLPANWLLFADDDAYRTYVATHKPAYDAAIAVQSLAARRDEAWEAIKAYRDMRESSGVKVAVDGVDYWFHSDVRSLIKYLFLLFLSTIFASYFPPGLKWKTMSDAEVVITTALVIQVFFKVFEVGGTLFAIGRLHRAAMLAAPEPSEYNYREPGPGIPPWPPIYGE